MESQIVVDADDKEETVQTVENVMPGLCRFQQLPLADMVFKRGAYSLESGFWGFGTPSDR